jgi:hypothetical protein
MYIRRPQSEGRTPDVIDGGAARPKIRRGTDLRGKKDPFPILGTLYAKRGIVRIGRKYSKSIVPHQLRCTKRPEPESPGPKEDGRGILLA